MEKLYELKENLCEELEKYGKKQNLSAGDLEVVDKLSHTIKNLDKIIEKSEEDGYSEERMGGSSMRGYSSANQRRDSRGRYSRESRDSRESRESRDRNYSRRYSRDHGGMIAELRELMEDAPDERTRMKFERFIDEMEM